MAATVKTIPEQINWVSVSDDLPDAGCEVTVCYERNDCFERDTANTDYDDSRDGDPWGVDGVVMFWAEKPLGPGRGDRC
jgi:hypothetical protein